ncbi:MAG TPA: hypothetical protein VFT51_12590 [Bacillales bacterium]|nr:hypothetical protein [Bacillales bacterium]
MDVLSIFLLIALILIYAWIKWEDRKNWESVYEISGNRRPEAEERYAYLKARQVKCRLKTTGSGGGDVAKEDVARNSFFNSVKIEVPKKEANKAFRLLREYNGQRS